YRSNPRLPGGPFSGGPEDLPRCPARLHALQRLGIPATGVGGLYPPPLRGEGTFAEEGALALLAGTTRDRREQPPSEQPPNRGDVFPRKGHATRRFPALPPARPGRWRHHPHLP